MEPLLKDTTVTDAPSLDWKGHSVITPLLAELGMSCMTRKLSLEFCHPPLFYASSSGILVPPTSRVAALNSTATFNCVGSGYTLYWRIDGLRDNDPTIKERGIHAVNPDPDDTFNSTLTVPAIIENNKTVIQCVVAVVNGSSGQKIESPTVTFLIQGTCVYYKIIPQPALKAHNKELWVGGALNSALKALIRGL